jgi:hypothetical protein
VKKKKRSINPQNSIPIMKRLLHISPLSRIAAIVALLMMTIQASAMTYEQAREQALFLTDKMAYELNLSQEQY